MNYEESRLRTFKQWPSHAGVEPRKIAKAGFYYLGQGVEVQCFSCGGRIADWSYGDRVVAVITRHKALDPNCPFIRDAQAAGNVPISATNCRRASESSHSSRISESESPRASESSPESTQVGGESDDGSTNCYRPGLSHSRPRVATSNSTPPLSRRELFQNESTRLESFIRWPHHYISPHLLAKAGFFYSGHGDKVECYYCEGTVEGWEEGDSPLEEHRRHYPTCSFLSTISQGVHIRISNQDSSPFPGEYEGLKHLGVHKHRVPRSPKYSTYEARLRSFKKWPPSIPQTPNQLSDAGFYFTGRGDQVRCFHCDGGLRLWEAGDDPWEEHARWFSECGYLFLVRGQQFIDQALNSLRCISTSMKVEGRGVKRKQNKTRIVTDDEMHAAMHSPQALAALEVGLEVCRVKLALKQRLETVGQMYSRSEDLINAAFALQTLEESDQEESWSVTSLAALLYTLRGTPPNSPAMFGKSKVSPRRDHVMRQDSSSSGRPSPSRDTRTTPPLRSSSHSSSSSCSGRKSESPVLEKPKVKERTDSISSAPQKSIGDLEDEIRRLKEWRQCKVCMDREVGVVLLPCGHLVTCALCTHSLGDCPLCRQTIQATVRTFLS